MCHPKSNVTKITPTSLLVERASHSQVFHKLLTFPSVTIAFIQLLISVLFYVYVDGVQGTRNTSHLYIKFTNVPGRNISQIFLEIFSDFLRNFFRISSNIFSDFL